MSEHDGTISVTEPRYMHRITLETQGGAERACEQLRDAGYDPIIGAHDREHGFAVDFLAPRGEKLEFLRPHLLPQLERHDSDPGDECDCPRCRR